MNIRNSVQLYGILGPVPHHDISPPPPLVDEEDHEVSTSMATISLHDEEQRSHNHRLGAEEPIASSFSSNTMTSPSPSERIHSGWPRRPSIQTRSYDADVERMASEESDEEN